MKRKVILICAASLAFFLALGIMLYPLISNAYNEKHYAYLMEDYSKSSIQSGVLSGLASASKFMGEAIAKVPVISNSQLDENLIEAGAKLDRRGDKRATAALEGLAQNRMSVARPFVENIRAVNELYNTPVTYLFDDKNIYIQRITG